MAKKTTRARAHRRDRRKAKASGWAREGKTTARVGHGASGSPGGPHQLGLSGKAKFVYPLESKNTPAPSLTFTVGDLWDVKLKPVIGRR